MNNKSKTIITFFKNRLEFLNLLQNNPGLIIIKLYASWCDPCKKIKIIIDGFFLSTPDNVLCCDIDIDKSTDFYSFLKSKKMVNGVPTLLCYKKGNISFIPDCIMSGIEPIDLDIFFKECGKLRISLYN